MSRNVIVIGGVALGPKAASRLKRLDPTANVTMIDENINISFGGCGIPYYVSGEINSLDALRSTTYGTVRTPEYFEHKGVHTLNQTRVTAIDRAAKTVTAKNLVTGEEKTLPYDRLIIATGIKLIAALRSNVMGPAACALLALASFVAIALLRWPLGAVLLVIGGAGCAWAWHRLGATPTPPGPLAHGAPHPAALTDADSGQKP